MVGAAFLPLAGGRRVPSGPHAGIRLGTRPHAAVQQFWEMTADMPLRSLTTSDVPLESVKGFVSILNGHYLTGFVYAVRNLFRR